MSHEKMCGKQGLWLWVSSLVSAVARFGRRIVKWSCPRKRGYAALSVVGVEIITH